MFDLHNSSVVISESERAKLNLYATEHGDNFTDMWKMYKFDVLRLPPLQQSLIELLMEQGQALAVHPLKHVSKEFLQDNHEELLRLTSNENLTVALICLFGEQILSRFDSASEFIAGLKEQGGRTQGKALQSAPPDWLPAHAGLLLDIRACFGSLCTTIYSALKKHSPESPNEETEKIIELIGINGLALYSLHGAEAPRIAQQYLSEFKQLEEEFKKLGREDSFSVTLLNIKEELLAEHFSDLLALARIQPYHFPHIIKPLSSVQLRECKSLVYDIFRVSKNGGADAVRALNSVKPAERNFVSRLLFHSGIFSDRAVSARAPMLLHENEPRHHQILSDYGHAFWGLSTQFQNQLHQKELEHREFILAAREHAGQGSGHFFARLQPEYWNARGLSFAERYGEAAGHVLKQRGEQSFAIENDPEYSSLSKESLEYANLKWMNRYTRMRLGSLDTSLIRSNLENYKRSEPINGLLTVSLLAYADPTNSFENSVYYNLLSKINAKGTLFLADVSDLDKIDEMLERICEDSRRGGTKASPLKIDQLILGAHCNAFTMQLSGVRHCPPATLRESEASSEQFINEYVYDRIARWKKYLAPGSDIVLIACSAMKPKTSIPAVGRMFEEIFSESHVHGLRDIGLLKGFDLDSDGRIFKLDWKEGHIWM